VVGAVDEAKVVDEVELVLPQQVRHELTAPEDQIMAHVELVDEHREPRQRGHDRSADGAIDDHPVALATVC
jgi:hypothetical protein